ncbi:MAG: ribosome-binding factor [Chloroflexi bacterium]|jgi:ribosome-binding factor A|nr:ribosome-binding factor [Chloroflexota bacterium]
MPQTHRIERVNQLIRQELSDLLLREVKDPRLSGYVCINSVETTPDLRYAKILVSCVCEEEKKKEILSALGHSSGFFRSEMAKHLKMRRVPELSFVWDNSIERGTRLIELIDRVARENKG